MDVLFWQALAQGIVQGITEFLPVSSTGHMILMDATFLKMDPAFSKVFEVVIQLGSILSVLIYFRKKIFNGLFSFKMDSPAWRLWLKVLPAVIPALVIGGLFGGAIQKYLYNPLTVGISLLLGGIVLLAVDSPRFLPSVRAKIPDVDRLSLVRAIWIGLAQCLAMIPGVSRSAATIVGGMCSGCTRALAAEFSFFLAIPTMAAASGYSLLKSGLRLTGVQWIALGIGFITAFFVAWAVIAAFMAFLKKHDFTVFAWYRIALGCAVLWFFLLK